MDNCKHILVTVSPISHITVQILMLNSGFVPVLLCNPYPSFLTLQVFRLHITTCIDFCSILSWNPLRVLSVITCQIPQSSTVLMPLELLVSLTLLTTCSLTPHFILILPCSSQSLFFGLPCLCSPEVCPEFYMLWANPFASLSFIYLFIDPCPLARFWDSFSSKMHSDCSNIAQLIKQ